MIMYKLLLCQKNKQIILLAINEMANKCTVGSEKELNKKKRAKRASNEAKRERQNKVN